MLAKVLSEQLHRSVDDVTRLEGIFDFTLEWAPETDVANASGRPSIFTAIREQLGCGWNRGGVLSKFSSSTRSNACRQN